MAGGGVGVVVAPAAAKAAVTRAIFACVSAAAAVLLILFADIPTVLIEQFQSKMFKRLTELRAANHQEGQLTTLFYYIKS